MAIFLFFVIFGDIGPSKGSTMHVLWLKSIRTVNFVILLLKLIDYLKYWPSYPRNRARIHQKLLSSDPNFRWLAKNDPNLWKSVFNSFNICFGGSFMFSIYQNILFLNLEIFLVFSFFLWVPPFVKIRKIQTLARWRPSRGVSGMKIGMNM